MVQLSCPKPHPDGTRDAVGSKARERAVRAEQGEESMHRSETLELRPCALCGAEISPARDRGYCFATEAFLCFDCAIRRGGRWDEAQDRWDVEADVSGLAVPEE